MKCSTKYTCLHREANMESEELLQTSSEKSKVECELLGSLRHFDNTQDVKEVSKLNGNLIITANCFSSDSLKKHHKHIEEEDLSVKPLNTALVQSVLSESDQNKDTGHFVKHIQSKARSGKQKDHSLTSFLTKSGSFNGHSPRMPRKHVPEFQPLVRRSTISKEIFYRRKSESRSARYSENRRPFSASPVKERSRQPSQSLINRIEKTNQKKPGNRAPEITSVFKLTTQEKKGDTNKCKIS